ncbi:MAG: 16S rRNA (cytosine(1402)-N(4))-methyltransferase RsmH [Candidatus Fermentibacteraceae bacterium]|nr:16S rRNA (cytosine(1402)-N(4))-methyltransferase RsmH [Candidatus Fermentibacteraceae bacterium]
MERGHLPIMPEEILEYLCASSPELVVDGTSGGGGHTALLSKAFPHSRILAVERDPSASEALSEKFSGTSVTVINSSYAELPEIFKTQNLPLAGGALFDLGLSSIQLDTPERGFSHRTSGPLDMRFDQSRGVPASDMLRSRTEKQIADIIFRYGEEGRSRSIARAIKQNRKLATTDDLADAVRTAVRGNPVKPLARVFQAIRIMVNDELQHLERLLSEMHYWTKPGCRIAVLTFHSLEDRLIKLHFRDSEYFRQFDPPWMLPTSAEKRTNSRARSARLRLGVRL